MRKKIAVILGCISIGLLAGCGSKDNASEGKAKDSDQVTLRVAMWDYSNTEYFKTLFDGFMEENPGIEIEPVEFPSDEYNTTITTQLGGKADFDVVFTKDMPSISALILQGHLLALDDKIEGDSEFDAADYNGLVEALKMDDKVYAIPFRSDNTLLYYNKNLFDAAQVDYPEDGMTMEEFHQLAQKMTSGEGNDKVYGAHIHTWTTNVTNQVRRLGAYNPDDESTYDLLLDYYNEVLAMQDEGLIMDYGALKSSNLHYSGVFYNQQAAMLPIGTWYINMLCENVKDFDWGVCSLPNNDGMGNDNGVGSVAPVSIGAYAKHVDEAWQFIKYICGDHGAEILAENGIVPGYISDGVKEIFDKLPEKYPNAPENLSKYITGDVSSVIETPMDPNAKEIETILGEMHSAVMTNSVSPEEGIQNAKERVEGIQG